MTEKTKKPPVRVDRQQPSARAHFQEPWIPFPEGIDALKTMARLIARPDEGRPMNLALIGDSGFGKSHLLDHFADCYPDLREEMPPRIQVLLISVVSSSDGNMLLRELLQGLGATYSPRAPQDELLRTFCIKAEVAGVGLIILDEFHNGINGRRDRTLSMIKTVRDISNRIRRPIVAGGDLRVKELLRYDPQLMERFGVEELPLWKDREAVKRFLASFERTFTMQEPSKLGTDATASLVMKLAGERMGSIAELVREAHRVAVSKGAVKIEEAHIRAAHPTVKRGWAA
jgi:hypothetical protein